MFETSFIQLFSARLDPSPRPDGSAANGDAGNWQRTLAEAGQFDGAVDAETGRQEPGTPPRSGRGERVVQTGDLIDLSVISDETGHGDPGTPAEEPARPDLEAQTPLRPAVLEPWAAVRPAEAADEPVPVLEPKPDIRLKAAVPSGTAPQGETRTPETEVPEVRAPVTQTPRVAPREITSAGQARVSSGKQPEGFVVRPTTAGRIVAQDERVTTEPAPPALRAEPIRAEAPRTSAPAPGITEGADPIPPGGDSWRAETTPRSPVDTRQVADSTGSNQTPRPDTPRAPETVPRVAVDPPVKNAASNENTVRRAFEPDLRTESTAPPRNAARFQATDRAVQKPSAEHDAGQAYVEPAETAAPARRPSPPASVRSDVRPTSPPPDTIVTEQGVEAERTEAANPEQRRAANPGLRRFRDPLRSTRESAPAETTMPRTETAAVERPRPERPYFEATAEEVEQPPESRGAGHEPRVAQPARKVNDDSPSAVVVAATLHRARKSVDPGAARGARVDRTVAAPAETEEGTEASPAAERRPIRPNRPDAPVREREAEARPAEAEPRLDVREGELRQERPVADRRPRRGAGERAIRNDARAVRVAPTQTDTASQVEGFAGPRATTAIDGPERSGATPRIHHRALAESIVARARALPANGSVEIRFALEPDDLGPVRVRIESRGEQLTIRIVASSGTAADTLHAGLARLTAQLSDAGIEDAQIDLGFDDSLNAGTQQREGRPAGNRRGGNAAASVPDTSRTHVTATARTGSRSKLDRIA